MVAKKLEGNFRGFPFLPQCTVYVYYRKWKRCLYRA